jgi:hypothetical protein
MRLKHVLPLFFLVTLCIACQKEMTSEFGDNAPPPSAAEVLAAKNGLMNMIKNKGLVSDFALKLEEKTRNSHAHSSLSLGTRSVDEDYFLDLSDNEDYMHYYNMVQNVINPKDYDCSPTTLSAYISNSTKSWTREDGQIYSTFGSLAFTYAQVYDNTGGDDIFGERGEYSRVVNRTFKNLKYFWDIPSDIISGSAHGSFFKDIPKLTQTIKFALRTRDSTGKIIPLTDAQALQAAEMVKITFGSDRFQNYEHPLLSFNAFAQGAIPQLGIVKKIVMGDGVMKAYEELGFGAVAPQVILAHEYGHHNQFANNYIPTTARTPEITRELELMADAYSGYYVSHVWGEGLKGNKIQQFLDVSFAIGDCSFTSTGHHGTPNQRMKAANLGYTVATEAQHCSRRLTSPQFYGFFKEALPDLIAPDVRSFQNWEVAVVNQ